MFSWLRINYSPKIILIKKITFLRSSYIANLDFGGRLIYKSMFLCMSDNGLLANLGKLVQIEIHIHIFGDLLLCMFGMHVFDTTVDILQGIR